MRQNESLGPTLSGVVSKEACCAICANTSGCAGWTWGDTVVHGDCFLRKAGTQWYKQSGAWSGVGLNWPTEHYVLFAFSNTLGDSAVLEPHHSLGHRRARQHGLHRRLWLALAAVYRCGARCCREGHHSMVALQLDAAAWAGLGPAALLGASSRMVQRRDMCLVPTQKSD